MTLSLTFQKRRQEFTGQQSEGHSASGVHIYGSMLKRSVPSREDTGALCYPWVFWVQSRLHTMGEVTLALGFAHKYSSGPAARVH